MLEKAEEDLQQADELIGQVHLTVRQSGHSAAFENAIKESRPRRGQSFFPSFLQLLSQWHPRYTCFIFLCA